jgi:hypothetical protein
VLHFRAGVVGLVVAGQLLKLGGGPGKLFIAFTLALSTSGALGHRMFGTALDAPLDLRGLLASCPDTTGTSGRDRSGANAPRDLLIQSCSVRCAAGDTEGAAQYRQNVGRVPKIWDHR